MLFAKRNNRYYKLDGTEIDRNNDTVVKDEYIVRSNAMIVSADGTVSATKFAMPNIPDLAATITNIQSDIGDIETALDAIINGSN